MEVTIFIGLAVSCALAVALAIYNAVLLTRTKGLRAAVEQAEGDRNIFRQDAATLTEALREAVANKVRAETQFTEAEKMIALVHQERDAAYSERNQSKLDTQRLEKELTLAKQEVSAVEKRLADWEKVREENLQNAKAAVLEVGNILSTKLLADHKQETELAKKEAEERLNVATKALHDQFQAVVQSVVSLNDQVIHNREMTDTVWKALSSPSAAGHFAEVGLENCLKSFGLERSRDFAIQRAVGGEGEGGRLRPDAMVFLPFDSVLVIDSKASKFVLDLAQAEGTEQEESAYADLARSMNGHLRSLANKDYRSAILANYREAGRSGEIRRVLNVMYLQNDAALEKLSRADPEFQKKALQSEIVVVGPTLLACLIGFARVEIDLGRQAENQERIVDSVQSLLEAIGSLVDHTDKVGKGIKLAAENFSKLTGSINSRLLPRARRLIQLGVRPVKSRAIPMVVPSYQVVAIDAGATLDGEGEEIVSPVLLGRHD